MACSTTSVIGVDEEGRDWQTVGEWARRGLVAAILIRHGSNCGGSDEVYAPSRRRVRLRAVSVEDVWTCDGTQYVEGDDLHDGYLEFRDVKLAVDPTSKSARLACRTARVWGNWGDEVIVVLVTC